MIRTTYDPCLCALTTCRIAWGFVPQYDQCPRARITCMTARWFVQRTISALAHLLCAWLHDDSYLSTISALAHLLRAWLHDDSYNVRSVPERTRASYEDASRDLRVSRNTLQCLVQSNFTFGWAPRRCARGSRIALVVTILLYEPGRRSMSLYNRFTHPRHALDPCGLRLGWGKVPYQTKIF